MRIAIIDDDADVPLVFVTNMAQMAIHGYAVHALDFILKPINYYSFSIKMRGILALIGNRRRKSLVFPTTDGFLRISSDNLYYVEVRGHHLSFHTTQGVIRQRDSLRNWEAKLEGLPFERCNNSYLVNLKQVSVRTPRSMRPTNAIWRSASHSDAQRRICPRSSTDC